MNSNLFRCISYFVFFTLHSLFLIIFLFYSRSRTYSWNFSSVSDITDIGPKGIADFELCAGLCDKEGKSDPEIAVEEVEEECGYKVHPDQMEFVQKFCEYGARKMIYYVGKLC